ncbi:protein polyglycylase TTLL10 [Paramisgurnus dabryanus]|uniref:protein polyglycylase TTLL10 n=1 Tax=Paramisgurnus dabryanus TaxID=90735 RepID=UPI0031F3F8E9
MSSACCVEPEEEPCAGQTLDQQHVTNERDTQQNMDDQKETDSTLNAGEVERQKENREIRRKGATQKMHRRCVKQADGALRVSVSFDERDRDKRLEDPRGPGPFFFFGGNNGASIVILYCESQGWQRIYDKTRLDYKLKWCEIKSPATYYNFKAGSQLLYQIPNNKVLTTKIGLLNSLREYERVSSKVNYGHGNRRMKIEDFFPVTYRMDMKEERYAFFNGVCDDKSSMWICKPTGLNQGRGIFLLRTPEDIATFRERLQNKTEPQSNRKSPFTLPQARIVQEYIQNPLLLMGRKFDVRSYFLIACTSPYMVFFRHGYVRLTCNLYDPKSDNITAHLTNQYMQKKNPLYSLLKDETVWSMKRFNDYINEIYMAPKGLPKDWALGPFAKRMQQIIMQCFQAVKGKLDCKLGYFDLIGCDFLIDENFKVWLLEMNCNPALHTNCEVLKEVIPSTVTETLDLAFEIFNKCCCGSKLLPLNSQRDFVLLHDGESTAVGKQRHKTTGPLLNLNSKGSSTHNNANKTHTSAATTTTPTWKSSNRFTKCPINHATKETPACGWPNISQPSQQPVKLACGGSAVTQKIPISRDQETNQLRLHQPKPVRVELHLSKCTWQEPAEISSGSACLMSMKSAIRSLSTPALSNGLNSTLRLGAQGRQMDNTDHVSCNLKTSKIHLAQMDKKESKEKTIDDG